MIWHLQSFAEQRVSSCSAQDAIKCADPLTCPGGFQATKAGTQHDAACSMFKHLESQGSPSHRGFIFLDISWDTPKFNGEFGCCLQNLVPDSTNHRSWCGINLKRYCLSAAERTLRHRGVSALVYGVQPLFLRVCSPFETHRWPKILALDFVTVFLYLYTV